MKHTVTVIRPEVIGTINPELYGHFTEHIGGEMYGGLWVGKDSDVENIGGFRKDIIDVLRKIKAPVIRWPGGCFAETYSWRDGIGENRPVRPNWWTPSDNKYETNEVGTHEFVSLCEAVGAKPYFAVNVTSMTPQNARDWLDYCLSPHGTTTLALEREKNGHPEPFAIPYWGVGNENWGGGGNMTPDYYALEYRKYATLMENTGYGRISLIAGGANAFDYNWTQGLMANLAASYAPVNGMSFHYYCGASGDCVNYEKDNWYDLVARAGRMQELIDRHYAIAFGHDMTNRMGLKLVVDEWGCWHPGGSGPSKGRNLFEQQSTMRDAVISALTLNIFNNSCDKVGMANVAQMCNNLHCLFLAEGSHLVLTPTCHVFDMFKGHMGGQALRTLIGDNGDPHKSVSVSASVKEGTVTITATNLSCEEDAELDIALLGASLPAQGKMTLLTADDMRAHNTFENPDAVTPAVSTVDLTSHSVTLPAASVLMLEFDA